MKHSVRFVGGLFDGIMRYVTQEEIDKGSVVVQRFHKPKYDEDTGEMYDHNVVKDHAEYSIFKFTPQSSKEAVYIGAPKGVHPIDVLVQLVEGYGET